MNKREFINWIAIAVAQAPLASCATMNSNDYDDRGRKTMRTDAQWIEEFQAIEDHFNAAMISNDTSLIAQCITDDWVLVNPESGPVSREIILGIIGSGVLTHTTMTKRVHRAKVYDGFAVVTGRGQNTGTFQGEPISADEWITDVYVRRGHEWRCSLTHLTPALNGHS